MKKMEFFDNKNVISCKLKFLRSKKHWTQEIVAKKMQNIGINLDQQSISKIERNLRIVTDYELVGFCRIYDITEQNLLEKCYKILEENL